MGVIQAAIELQDSGDLEAHEREWFGGELAWLDKHLKSPACLREPGNHRAISRFQPRANGPIEKAQSIVALLEEHGVRVRMVTTDDPGTIIYEDAWQVVAKPRGRKRSRG